ncbi:MAG: hypothetical protein MJ001_07460 [Paludibacteraceae bacterium]|nr:hypothetical protein [Paludibacteraceae bacterium]
MTPVVDDFVKRFNLIDYVVVADSGLMTGKNLTLTIPTVTIRLPHNRQKQTQTLFLASE